MRSMYKAGQTVRFWPTPYDDATDLEAQVGWIDTITFSRTEVRIKVRCGEYYDWVDASQIDEVLTMPDLSTPEKIVAFLTPAG